MKIKFGHWPSYLRFSFGTALALISGLAIANWQDDLKMAISKDEKFEQLLMLNCLDGYDSEGRFPIKSEVTISYKPLKKISEIYTKTSSQSALETLALEPGVRVGKIQLQLRARQAKRPSFIFAITPSERDLNLSYLVTSQSMGVGDSLDTVAWGTQYFGAGMKVEKQDCHVSYGQLKQGTSDGPSFVFSNTVDSQLENSVGCKQFSGLTRNVPRIGAFWDANIAPSTGKVSFHSDMWGYDYEDLYCEIL